MDAFAVLAMALIGIQYLRLLPTNTNAQLLGLLCLAAVCHVVLGRYQYGFWISEPYQIALSPVSESILNLGRNVAPGVFLFLSHSMLRDGKRLPKTLLVLFFVQLLLEEPIHFVVGQGFPAERLLTEIVPSLLQSVLVGWAIFWIVAEWPSDLIESRRATPPCIRSQRRSLVSVPRQRRVRSVRPTRNSLPTCGLPCHGTQSSHEPRRISFAVTRLDRPSEPVPEP